MEWELLQQLIGRWDNYGSDKRPLRNYQSNIIDLVKNVMKVIEVRLCL